MIANPYRGEASLEVGGETLLLRPSFGDVRASCRNLSGRTSTASTVLSAEALRPPSPVRLAAQFGADGLSLSWTRRSRAGFAWQDGIDTPLGEAREFYRVVVTGTAGSMEIETERPEVFIAKTALDGIGTGNVVIQVRQVGDGNVSHPATLNMVI